jgi:hypothetical protein
MKLFKEERARLRGNLALLPLIVLLNAMGFHLEKGNSKGRKSKICGLLLMGLYIYNKNINFDSRHQKQQLQQHPDEGGNGHVVLFAIASMNYTCIYFTLIIISVHNMFAKCRLRKIFKCFDIIDATLHACFRIETSARMFAIQVALTLALLLITACTIFAVEYVNCKVFNAGQCIFTILVFILSVKISFYCMLVHCIKLRFSPLHKYLRANCRAKSSCGSVCKSSRSNNEFGVSESVRHVSELREISLIYDEMLEIISLLNESFSTLLSSAFSKWTFFP